MHKRVVFIALYCLFIANLTAWAQDKRQIILVSTYQIENKESANQFDSMMEAAVDAMSDYGLKHIGVFKAAEPDKTE